MKNVIKYRERAYDAAVAKTLLFYESWILPCPKMDGFQKQTRISLREAKLREFREKKKLLNPYERDMLLDSSTQDERLRLEDLTKRTNFQSIMTDKLRYDRHKGAYDFRVHDFPDSYSINDSPLEYQHDPDGLKKFRLQRLNFKLMIVGGFLIYQLIRWKTQ